MPIARWTLRCGSSNAFHPQAALLNLFLEQQQPWNFYNARRITLSHGEQQGVPNTSETPPQHGEDESNKSASIPPSEYVNTASLRHTLKTLREKNRDKFLGKDNLSKIDVQLVDHGKDRGSHVDNGSVPLKQVQDPPLLDGLIRKDFPKKRETKKSKAESSKSKAALIRERKASERATEKLEYEGKYVRPSGGEADPDQEFPWTKDVPNDASGPERLHAEILEFLEYIKPTLAEKAAYGAILQEVCDFVQQITPHLDTEVFGSQASGLVLGTSDIDIRIFEPANKHKEGPPSRRQRKEIVLTIQHLTNALKLNHKDFKLVRLRYARYPLISMVHSQSGLEVQIVAGNATPKSQGLIKQYLDEDSLLYAQYALVKSMLEIRGLTDVYRGGLGSYTLIMMIVAASKRRPMAQAGNEPASAAGSKFLAFLEFYSRLNTYKEALSLDWPYSIAKHNGVSECSLESYDSKKMPALQDFHELALIDPIQPYLLCLQDPADSLNDLGRKGYGWKHIQTTFQVLKDNILEDMSRIGAAEGRFEGSVLSRVVGPCFTAFQKRRAMVETYGQKILDKEQAKREEEKEAADKKAVEAETDDV